MIFQDKITTFDPCEINVDKNLKFIEQGIENLLKALDELKVDKSNLKEFIDRKIKEKPSK